MMDTATFHKNFDKTVYLRGGDGMNWVFDQNRACHRRALKSLGVSLATHVLWADIVYSLWWRDSLFLDWRFRVLRALLGKTVVAHATNDLKHHVDSFNRFREHIDVWVCFNSKQERFLVENGIERHQIYVNPDYINEEIFRCLDKSRAELAEELKIDLSKIEDRFLIGSFQRDSLGTDLTKPKWQKNPDLLIEVLKTLDRSRFMLVLAGPRRHYLVNKCIQNDIPYVFVGNERLVREMHDDVRVNTQPPETVNLLCNLVDVYLVTSVSEGGPRAILEATLTRTLVLSTNVGIAEEFLDEYCICSDERDFRRRLGELLDGSVEPLAIVEKNLLRVKRTNSFDSFKRRIAEILSATRTTAK